MNFKIPASLSNLYHNENYKLFYILKILHVNQIAIECILWLPIKFQLFEKTCNEFTGIDENNQLIINIIYSLNIDWLLNNKRTYISKAYRNDRTNWKLVLDANYKNGEINGLIRYYRDGNIVQITEYDMGKVVRHLPIS